MHSDEVNSERFRWNYAGWRDYALSKSYARSTAYDFIISRRFSDPSALGSIKLLEDSAAKGWLRERLLGGACRGRSETGKAETGEFIQRSRAAIRVVVRPDNLGRLTISRWQAESCGENLAKRGEERGSAAALFPAACHGEDTALHLERKKWDRWPFCFACVRRHFPSATTQPRPSRHR